MGIESGVSRSPATLHLDLHPLESATSHLKNDQPDRGLIKGKRPRDEMVPESSSEPSTKASCQRLEMTGSPMKASKIADATEASTRYKQTLQDLENWKADLLQSRLTRQEKSKIIKELEVSYKGARNFYEITISELRGKDYRHQSDRITAGDVIELIFENVKPKWLDLIVQIMQFLPKEARKVKIKTVERGYNLVITLLIDMIQLGMISEDQLSHFLNNNKNVQPILSHVLMRLNKYGQNYYSDYPAIGAKKFMHDSHCKTLAEAQILRCE
ncbi:hypothetical protein PCASD_10305 [Puccinia coronata f. sp. avenae]|uniref:Uncharacterized protein n=1 Tax=Puccinia coronata f. sp. avenae TaxID=200324 RepID=A0A2N5U7G6_9BASI|nr:hypothetical protein PCASD_10305 [Puccinia coronata f. sp. avenae]